MQSAGAASGALDTDVVAAAVAIVRRMQGLMEVADQVQQELQRQPPFVRSRGRAPQLTEELVDFVEDAVGRGTFGCLAAHGARPMAEARSSECGPVECDVDVVPLARLEIMLLSGIAILVSKFVRPGCFL